METGEQVNMENVVDEEVLREVEKRKHCKNAFEDRFLSVALSSFVNIPSLNIEDDDQLLESSIMNASVNVSVRSELIKEMIKQTVKSVDNVIASNRKSTISKTERKDESMGDENYSSNLELIFNEERYKAYKENDQERIVKYSSLDPQIDHLLTHQKLEELPIPQSFSHLQYYVLNIPNEISREKDNQVLDLNILNEIFQGFESVLEMPEEKVEELFALEGINIYEEIELIPPNDPMDGTDSGEFEKPITEVGGVEMTVEEQEFNNIEQEVEPLESVEEMQKEESKPKEKVELKYYRIIDMEKPLEVKKSTKQTTLRTRQNVEDNLKEIKPKVEIAQTTYFTKLEDMFNQAFVDPEFNGSILFPSIDIFALSDILSISIEEGLPERAKYELGGYDDCEYEGIDDYLFGTDQKLIEDCLEESTELGGHEQETIEVTVPRTKTIIDNLIEHVEKKKIVPIVKISSIINDNLSNNQTTTLTEQYQTSHLNNQNVTKARFFMALLHTVHQTNIKGNTQITLSNVGENSEEVKIVTRNIPAKTTFK